MGGRQGGVSAEVDFMNRCEPAQVPALAVRPSQGGFGKIVLVCDGLHHLVRQPVLQDEDGSGVALKGALGKGIDLVHGQRRHIILQKD